VVGGGAAGIVAAWSAATHGAHVLLLEKTERLGTKILISGGGKCNITHAGSVEDVLRAFRRNEANFLRPSLYAFSPDQILSLIALETYARPNGRVFPSRASAKDVVAVLATRLREAGVAIRYGARCSELLINAGAISGVRTDEEIRAESVILAVGGSSYPATGTTGDGWALAKGVGHTIVKVRAALAPINLVTPFPWAGVALRDCQLKAKQGVKELAQWREDLLFTHHGVSGPCALGISREVAEGAGAGPIELTVDVIPDDTFDGLFERLREWLELNPRRPLAAFAAGFVPERLSGAVVESAGIDSALQGARVSRKQRAQLVETLKAWKLGVVRDVPIEKGEVVAGGVPLAEVNPKTMESKIVRGLYLCGEVLDIAGPVGGYNLQAAWSTGFVSGVSAAKTP
jgi:hypothetical protein